MFHQQLIVTNFNSSLHLVRAYLLDHMRCGYVLGHENMKIMGYIRYIGQSCKQLVPEMPKGEDTTEIATHNQFCLYCA